MYSVIYTAAISTILRLKKANEVSLKKLEHSNLDEHNICDSLPG
tara:strand:- start:1754 stop:1885 length:132 start_codon:yes stop_codon:yes gene_type:complete